MKKSVPVYTLQPCGDGCNYWLCMGDNFRTPLLSGNLTSIVGYVKQEFHCHTFWEICLVLRGSSTQNFLDKSETMQPGSVYILRPHDVHCISPTQSAMPANLQSTPYVHRDIYIPIEKMKRLCDSLGENLYEQLLSSKYPLSAVLPATEMNQLEASLNSVDKQNENFDFMHSVISSHILCSVLEKQRYPKSQYPAWLTNLLVDLDREDFMTKSVREIIDTVGYNQSHVCRQFKKYTKQTLVDYIHKRKCSYSLLLLPSFGIPVAQIAQRLQFSDESAYIRIFKKTYGITPGQWRKKLSKTLPTPANVI